MPKHDHHWTFGNGCHISFPGGGAPVLEADHGFDTREGCSAISDAGGALLFYTDGVSVYDKNHQLITNPPLGGHTDSCHSALIVPPAGGGSKYHIFTVGNWPANEGPLFHTTVAVSGSTLTVSGPVALVPGLDMAAERLAAISHAECSKYWLVWLNVDAEAGFFCSMLVDSDLAPSIVWSGLYPYPAAHEHCIKFSPDGNLIAMASQTAIDMVTFDRSTGAIAPYGQVINCTGTQRVYGLEFSPDSKKLFFTGHLSGELRRFIIAPGTTLYSNTQSIWTTPTVGRDNLRLGALQLAPNGKIYGTRVGVAGLIEIGNPNDPTPAATPTSIGFDFQADQAGGGTLQLNLPADLGLPSFTRIADDCVDEDRCATIAAQVEEQISGRDLHNLMRPCRGEPEEPACGPLEMPAIRPQTFIRWGDSPCDCIEGDDTEVMHLTVCNPYSNLTLSNVTVYELVVVDANGNPVPNLPDGSPSIQLVPVGPHCFDDIAPCSCVSREFVLRLRGAPGGPYRILVRGICFDACFHGDTEACFTFEVCKD